MSRPARTLPVFWLAFALVLAVRVVVALARLDELELELYGGSLARALLEGLPLDPANLPIIAHLRGSFVFGLLTVPAFLVLGPTLLAVKSVGLLWSALTGGCFAWILSRFAGRAAGLAGALLFAFLPPSFVIVDVLALGSHGDSVLPYLLALGWLLARGKEGPLGPVPVLVLGLLLGCGAFFSANFAIALPALALAWLALDPRLWRRAATLLLPVGAALPVLAIPLVTRSTKLQGREASSYLLPDGLGAAWHKVASTLGGDLRRSLLFEEHGGAWASYLFLAAVLVGLVLTVRRALRRDALAIFLLAYPLAYLFAFGLLDFRLDFYNTLDGLGSRYTMPVLPCLAGWIAIGAQELWSARRPLALALGAAGVLPGLAAFVALAEPWRGVDQPTVRGTRFATFQDHFEHASPNDLALRLDWIDRLDPDWPAVRPLYYDSVRLQASSWKGLFPLLADVRRVRAMDPRLGPYLLVRMGHDAYLQRHDGVRSLPQGEHLLAWLNELETIRATRDPGSVPGGGDDAKGMLPTDEELSWIVRGAAKAAPGEMFVRRMATGAHDLSAFAWVARLPERLRVAGAEGLGFQTGGHGSPYHRAYLELLDDAADLPAAAREAFFFAAGLGYRWRFAEPSYFVPPPGLLRFEERVPEVGRAAFRAGLAAPHEEVDSP